MFSTARQAAFRPPPAFWHLTAGRPPYHIAGYTLLELLVVIMLLSLLLGFAIPAFQRGGGADSLEEAIRTLRHAVGKLKTAAFSRQQIHRLHLDIDDRRIWVTRDGENYPDDISQRQSEWTLEDAVHIAAVYFPGDHNVRSGTVEIAFYPQGYSDRAIVRLADDGSTTMDLIIEAFLPMALIASNHDIMGF